MAGYCAHAPPAALLIAQEASGQRRQRPARRINFISNGETSCSAASNGLFTSCSLFCSLQTHFGGGTETCPGMRTQDRLAWALGYSPA